MTTKQVAAAARVSQGRILSWLRRGWVEADKHPRVQYGAIVWSKAQCLLVVGLANMQRRHLDEWKDATGQTRRRRLGGVKRGTVRGPYRVAGMEVMTP